MKSNRAFTIVELLVILATLAILMGISVVGYGGMQRNAREKERESDIAIIQASLEEFYERNGYYPSADSVTINDSDSDTLKREKMTFLTRTLNIPETALVAPGAEAGTTSSLQRVNPDAWTNNATALEQFAATYGYITYTDAHADPPVECTGDDHCTAYILGYYSEVERNEDESGERAKRDMRTTSKHGF